MLTQREYDIRQLNSEQRIKSLFEEWRKGFLKGRLVQPPQQQMPPQDMQQQMPPGGSQ